MNSTSPFRFERMASNAAAGSPTARKGGPTPGSPAGSNGPTSCADRLIVLTLLPLRVQMRTRVSSGPDILLRTGAPAVLHGGALFMTCVRRVSECHRKEPRAARRFSIRRSLPGRCRWSAARSTRKPKWLTFWLKTRSKNCRVHRVLEAVANVSGALIFYMSNLPTFDDRRKSIIALSSVSCRRGSTI